MLKPRTRTLLLDWKKAPLSENQRWPHWAARNRVVQDVRTTARLGFAGFAPCERIRVELVWHVADKRRRDEDNVAPTLKALCDGIVDAGVVPDDTPRFMDKVMPRIVQDAMKGGAHFTLTVTEVETRSASEQLAEYRRTSAQRARDARRGITHKKENPS